MLDKSHPSSRLPCCAAACCHPGLWVMAPTSLWARGWCISCLVGRERWKIQVLPCSTCENTFPGILLDGFSKANASPARPPLIFHLHQAFWQQPPATLIYLSGWRLFSLFLQDWWAKAAQKFCQKWKKGSWSLCGEHPPPQKVLRAPSALSIPAAGAGVCLREINDLYFFLPPWLPLSAHVLWPQKRQRSPKSISTGCLAPAPR